MILNNLLAYLTIYATIFGVKLEKMLVHGFLNLLYNILYTVFCNTNLLRKEFILASKVFQGQELVFLFSGFYRV